MRNQRRTPKQDAASASAVSVPPYLWHHEKIAELQGARCVAGVDEAGRGPLAGPVVAAAVILPWPLPALLNGINDSKQLTPLQREKFFVAMTEMLRIPNAVGIVAAEVIDQINIVRATHLAMRQAIDHLPVRPDHVLVDGHPIPHLDIPQTAIIGGDTLSYSIAAASIIAKVTRDRLMMQLHNQFPQYNFARHKGYGTPEHIALLKQHGPCPQHRRSFKHTAQPGAPPPSAAT